jgi:hypothetical protein
LSRRVLHSDPGFTALCSRAGFAFIPNIHTTFSTRAGAVAGAEM